MQSNAEKVWQFTKESSGLELPNRPELMTKPEVEFITKMIIDEMLELLSTVYNPETAKHTLFEHIKAAKSLPLMDQSNSDELIAEQADAFVDIEVYMKNAAAKKGINLDEIFSVVHDANMAKKDPYTGEFIRRGDGKVMKPAGWKAPDITECIKKQIENGSFKGE